MKNFANQKLLLHELQGAIQFYSLNRLLTFAYFGTILEYLKGYL